MRSPIFIPLMTLAYLFLSVCISAPDTRVCIVEPETEIEFPSEIKFSLDSEDYALQITGATVRKKWVFEIYAIAHYLQVQEGAGDLDRESVLADGPAKQITIQYVHNLPANIIIKALRRDFKQNTTPEEYREIETYIEQMLNCLVRPVRKGDVFMMRWLSGGRIYLELNGKRLGNVKNELFARCLWAIWFGKCPVVDPAALIPETTEEAF
jgi:hypothetical protein